MGQGLKSENNMMYCMYYTILISTGRGGMGFLRAVPGDSPRKTHPILTCAAKNSILSYIGNLV
jgi:hypothetical protein